MQWDKWRGLINFAFALFKTRGHVTGHAAHAMYVQVTKTLALKDFHDQSSKSNYLAENPKLNVNTLILVQIFPLQESLQTQKRNQKSLIYSYQSSIVCHLPLLFSIQYLTKMKGILMGLLYVQLLKYYNMGTQIKHTT